MKKAAETVQNILTVLLLIISVGMMIFTVISVTTVNRNDRNIFGYKVFKVMSDSMKATDFEAGDLIISKVTDPTTLQEGDIITFSSNDVDTFGEIITHKIRRKTTDASGEPGFVTYGTTTGVDDASIVTYPYILGKYVGRIPKLGYFFDFLKTTPGYVLCILLPFLLLIISRGVATVNAFRDYKKEQMQELEAEKAKIEEERENTKKMMEELLALKSQLAQQNTAAPETEENKPGEEAKPAGEEKSAEDEKTAEKEAVKEEQIAGESKEESK